MLVLSPPTLLLALYLTLVPFSALTQILPFEHYSPKDGLPSQWITAIYQDRRGYLWIASDEGLSVYDGVSFKNYGLADGLPVSHVWNVIESRTEPGTMWIGTHLEGVVKLAGGKFTAIQLGSTPPSNTVATLFEDHEGVLWCGTNQGVCQVRDGRATSFPIGNDTGWARFIVQTRDSTIWISLDKNVHHYFPKTGKLEPMVLPFAGTPKRSMIEDTEGTLWLATEKGEIVQWRDHRVIATKALPVAELHDMLLDYDGSLWAVTSGGVLNIPTRDFPRGAIVQYSSANGLPTDDVLSCELDREHNLWFGTQGNGMAKLSVRNLLRFPLPGLRSDVMNRAALADARGRMFIVSEQGLWEIWKKRDAGWQQHLHRPQPLRGPMWQADFGPDSTLWIAMRAGGICGYRIKPEGEGPSRLVATRMLKPGRDLPAGFPLAFMVDRHNQLWCNMRYLGLAHIDLNTGRMRKLYTAEDGMPTNTVRAILRDRDDQMWFGGFFGGIALFRLENHALKLLRTITTADGLPDNSIRMIMERRNGEVWIGTRFGGVGIWRDGKMRTLSTRDGLLSNAVWGLAEDEKGGMWIGTTVGMQYYLPDSSRLSTDKKLSGELVGSVGVAPGGMVWGLSNQNLILYEVDRAGPPPVPPLVYITGWRVNGVEREISPYAQLPHDQNLCIVKFGGLSFKDEKSLCFKYRLQGLEESWQGPVQERTVTFASLRPGAYTFEVSAMNVEGVPSAAPARLSFEILPPFWQRWWFIASSTFALAGLFYGFHRLRLRRVLEIEKIRSRIALDLHDDIGAGLTHIGLLSEVALQKSGTPLPSGAHRESDGSQVFSSEAARELSTTVARVGAIARELSAAMSDVVWSINPKHDSVEALQRRLRAFASETCNAKGIQLKMEFSKQIAGLKLNPEVRRNLLLIAKEALHNLAKYSASPTAQVALQVNGKNLLLTVADEGRGFEKEKAKSGNGLINMQARAEKINGMCEIFSAPGQGTRIITTMPY